jgi:hypothetical protein
MASLGDVQFTLQQLLQHDSHCTQQVQYWPAASRRMHVLWH